MYNYNAITITIFSCDVAVEVQRCKALSGAVFLGAVPSVLSGERRDHSGEV